ncbi:hypothetical protein BGZ52_012030, partial [Haplosporangium bisporale]
DHQSIMVTRGDGSTHQLEGVESHLASHSAFASQRQIDQHHFGQHNDDCIHQQVWRHSLPSAHGPSSKDMVLLSRNRNPPQDHI